jgi:outer membrane receptor for ferrienterochelin and colicins
MIMRKIRYLIALLSILNGICLKAQVRGKVVEISKNADTSVVTGVIVVWDKTSIAVNTDQNGNFNLRTSAQTNKLRIQAVGYENQTVAVNDTTKFLLLVLKSGVNLNEVEIVYYSNGTEISYLNPIKMEVLNERSLMKAACCNLSESFETNPSIDVNFADAVSGTRQIQMLGLSGQYAQITKENMPYLRGLANNYGLTFIPGTWIQSIQLSKGAGSVINGYESFTGQINTELQHPQHSDKLNFNTYVNENGRNEYNLNLSHRINPKLSVGLLSHTSYNPLAQDLNKDGFADIPTGRQYNFMNKYAYESGTGFEAQFGGGYLKDERQGGQFKELIKNYNDSTPLYKIGINNEKWELFSKTGFVFRKKPTTSTGLQLSYLNHNQHNFYGNNMYDGLQKTFYANYIYQGVIGNTNNTYKVGASFLNDDVNESFNLYKFKRVEQVGGAFLEFAKSYKEKFNMVAGIRADQHNYYGLFFTPRLHLRYAFKPNSVLRLSGGRALRTANIFTDNAYLMASSRSWIIEGSDLTMPYGLKPEIAWNYGLNFTQKFKINYRDAYITLDAYRTDFVNQVVTDVDHNTQQVLIYNLKGPSYSNTFQFEFNVEPRKRFFIKTAYRYVDTKVTYKQGLLQKALVSRNRAFINFSYETKNSHWQFDFTSQYNGSKRLPNTENNPGDYKRAKFSPDYFNLLGQITYLTKINKADFNVYLGVENLLNYKQSNPIVASDLPYSKYFDASMVWGPVYGRMLYAGLRLKIK